MIDLSKCPSCGAQVEAGIGGVYCPVSLAHLHVVFDVRPNRKGVRKETKLKEKHE